MFQWIYLQTQCYFTHLFNSGRKSLRAIKEQNFAACTFPNYSRKFEKFHREAAEWIFHGPTSRRTCDWLNQSRPCLNSLPKMHFTFLSPCCLLQWNFSLDWIRKSDIETPFVFFFPCCFSFFPFIALQLFQTLIRVRHITSYVVDAFPTVRSER